VECNLRCVNFRRASDPRRAFLPALRVTAISDDWYRSTMGVIMISLRTPQSARENFECTREHLGAPTTSLGVPTTSLGVPTTSLGAPMTSLGVPMTSLEAPTSMGAPGSAGDKPGSTLNHCGAVWEKLLLWECCWCALKSWLLLIVQQFSKLMYSVCILS